MNVLTYPHTCSLYHTKIKNIFPYLKFNFGRSALVNAVELHKNKIQGDIHLTFIVDSELIQKLDKW